MLIWSSIIVSWFLLFIILIIPKQLSKNEIMQLALTDPAKFITQKRIFLTFIIIFLILNFAAIILLIVSCIMTIPNMSAIVDKDFKPDWLAFILKIVAFSMIIINMKLSLKKIKGTNE
jgi:hypothetical protein